MALVKIHFVLSFIIFYANEIKPNLNIHSYSSLKDQQIALLSLLRTKQNSAIKKLRFTILATVKSYAFVMIATFTVQACRWGLWDFRLLNVKNIQILGQVWILWKQREIKALPYQRTFSMTFWLPFSFAFLVRLTTSPYNILGV